MKYLIILFLVMGCAHKPSSLRVNNISDIITKGDKEVFVYVELNKNQPNRLSVFNWETYEEFLIYKKAKQDTQYVAYANLKAGVKPAISALITIFEDRALSTEFDRYRVHPLVKGDELDKLPIEYVTKDSSYHSLIENTEEQNP